MVGARRFFVAVLAVWLVFSCNYCAAAKKVVAIMPLENVSGYETEKVAEIMTEQLIVAVHSSGIYTVVERTQLGAILREQGFQNTAVDPSKAVELAKLSGADYTMLGKVTMAVVEKDPKFKTIERITNVLHIGKSIADRVDPFRGKIGLEFRLVDNTTGEIVIAKMIEGVKSGSNEVDAVHNACKIAAESFLRELDSMSPFRARIAEISGSDIYIDAGSESGLRRGEILIVARESSPIIVNGKTVGMRQNEIGKIKVVEVNGNYAICRAEANGNLMRKGDVVKRS